MTLIQYLTISRPRFWLYLMGPFLVGSVLTGQTQELLSQWHFWIFLIYFSFPANLFVYGVNDIFDFETDKHNPKKQDYEALVIPSQHSDLWKIVLILNIPFWIVLITLFPSVITLTGFFGFIFLSWQYSALPIRAKSKPFLDSLFNILYIMPGIVGFGLFSDQSLDWKIVLATGLWTMAMHSYSAVPDIEVDTKSSTPTIATTLGYTLTLLYCGVLYGVSTLIISGYLFWLGILGCIIYETMILLSLFYPQNIFKYYILFPYINMIFGFIAFWSIILA